MLKADLKGQNNKSPDRLNAAENYLRADLDVASFLNFLLAEFSLRLRFSLGFSK
jgi:hypothetical protein